MKIALIAPTYLPARRANTIQVIKMAQAIVQNRDDVLVLVPDTQVRKRQNGTIRSWDVLEKHYGVSTEFSIEWIPVRPQLRKYDYGIKAVLRGKVWGADLIYTRLPQAAAVASRFGMKSVYELHDIPTGKTGNFLFQLFSSSKAPKRLVVISRQLLADLQQRSRSIVDFTVVAPDGIDLERYETVITPEDARDELVRKLSAFPVKNVFTVGYTGHFYAGRGIEIIKQLAVALPTVQFLLVGGEPEDVRKLLLWCEREGVENMVITGFINNRDLPLFQQACDVLLMPYQESVAASSGGDIAKYLSPMKMFEYMATGRVILSSDLPVLREVLSEDNAVLLPAKDITAWKDTIVHVRENPSLYVRLSLQARKDVEKYSWQKRAKRIFDGL